MHTHSRSSSAWPPAWGRTKALKSDLFREENVLLAYVRQSQWIVLRKYSPCTMTLAWSKKQWWSFEYWATALCRCPCVKAWYDTGQGLRRQHYDLWRSPCIFPCLHWGMNLDREEKRHWMLHLPWDLRFILYTSQAKLINWSWVEVLIMAFFLASLWFAMRFISNTPYRPLTWRRQSSVQIMTASRSCT